METHEILVHACHFDFFKIPFQECHIENEISGNHYMTYRYKEYCTTSFQFQPRACSVIDSSDFAISKKATLLTISKKQRHKSKCEIYQKLELVEIKSFLLLKVLHMNKKNTNLACFGTLQIQLNSKKTGPNTDNQNLKEWTKYSKLFSPNFLSFSLSHYPRS